jgi:hypothetical protein
MPLNLGNIRQASNRKAEELAIESSRNALPDRGFTDSWRSHEADYLPFDSST